MEKFNVPDDPELRKKIIQVSDSVIVSHGRSLSEHRLSLAQVDCLMKYIEIFRKNDQCRTHWHINSIISSYNGWDHFKEIRSMNKHGEQKQVEGILPIYYRIVCEVLEIDGDGGDALTDSKRY